MCRIPTTCITGIWLREDVEKDGVVTSYDEVETFAGSSLALSGDRAT